MRDLKWKWIDHGERRLYNVGVLGDGSLYNPRGYDEAVVREAVRQAEERYHASCSIAAKKAAITRQRRRERLTYDVQRGLLPSATTVRASIASSAARGSGTANRLPVESEASVGSGCWSRVN